MGLVQQKTVELVESVSDDANQETLGVIPDEETNNDEYSSVYDDLFSTETPARSDSLGENKQMTPTPTEPLATSKTPIRAPATPTTPAAPATLTNPVSTPIAPVTPAIDIPAEPQETQTAPTIAVNTKRRRGGMLSMKEQREMQLQQIQQSRPQTGSPSPTATPTANTTTTTTKPDSTQQPRTTTAPKTFSKFKPTKNDYQNAREEVLKTVEEETEEDSVDLTIDFAAASDNNITPGSTCLGLKRYGQQCNITQVEANGYCLFHQSQSPPSLSYKSKNAAPVSKSVLDQPSDPIPLTEETGEPEAEQEYLELRQVEKETEHISQARKISAPRQVPQYLFVLPNLYTKLEDGVHSGYRLAE